jgi:hypothetical protein
MPPRADLTRRAVAEALGTALLLATVVGSGIMAERLVPALPEVAERVVDRALPEDVP